MVLDMEKRRGFIINTVWVLLVVGMVYLFFKYAIFIVLPFLAGFAVAAMLNPAVRFFVRRFDMKRKPFGIMLLLVFYATIGMLLTLLAVRLTVLVGKWSDSLPEFYRSVIEPALGELFSLVNRAAEKIDGFFGGADAEYISNGLAGVFSSLEGSIGTAVSELSVKLLSRLSALAASVPRFVIGLVFTVISSFFFVSDYEKIIGFLKERLPENVVSLLTFLRGKIFVTSGKYLRSYALIMLITFAELFLGLSIIGFREAPAAALGIAVFDILPVFGTGGIIVPWAALRFFKGDVGFAVGLIVIWVVISIVRNIIEPKIVGSQVGLPPLATLAAMYIGTKLFGVTGLFLLPISLAVILPLFLERVEKKDAPADQAETPRAKPKE